MTDIEFTYIIYEASKQGLALTAQDALALQQVVEEEEVTKEALPLVIEKIKERRA